MTHQPAVPGTFPGYQPAVPKKYFKKRLKKVFQLEKNPELGDTIFQSSLRLFAKTNSIIRWGFLFTSE
jgi:hypothetical protein